MHFERTDELGARHLFHLLVVFNNLFFGDNRVFYWAPEGRLAICTHFRPGKIYLFVRSRRVELIYRFWCQSLMTERAWLDVQIEDLLVMSLVQWMDVVWHQLISKIACFLRLTLPLLTLVEIWILFVLLLWGQRRLVTLAESIRYRDRNDSFKFFLRLELIDIALILDGGVRFELVLECVILLILKMINGPRILSLKVISEEATADILGMITTLRFRIICVLKASVDVLSEFDGIVNFATEQLCHGSAWFLTVVLLKFVSRRLHLAVSHEAFAPHPLAVVFSLISRNDVLSWE